MKKQKVTVDVLNKLVIAEAKKLKENAKKSELKKLDFDRLDSQRTTNCVYGLMTGDCFSKRSQTLIQNSCKRVFNVEESENIEGTLNGSPIGKKRSKIENTAFGSYSEALYWSPIEVFIDKDRNQKNGNNKRLIEFLKDETKILKLK